MNNLQTTYNPWQFSPFQAASRPITNDWKYWIVENKLLGNHNEAILQVLLAHGFDRKIVEQELQTIDSHPYFLAAQATAESLQKLHSHLKIYTELEKLSQRSQRIERRETISQEEFLENYYTTSTPLILTGIMHNWKALSTWTPQYFADRFGDVEIEIQSNRSSDPLYEINLEEHRQKIRLREYVEKVLTGGPTNDYYMVANNRNLDLPEFAPLFAEMDLFPAYFAPEPPPGTVYFWLGPQGTITPLHHDPCNLMMAQVYGRKKWHVISPHYTPQMYNHLGVFSAIDFTQPDYDRYPLFREVHVVEEILHPGEVIFIPVGWWHFVESLDISISVSMTQFLFPNQYSWKYPNRSNYNNPTRY